MKRCLLFEALQLPGACLEGAHLEGAHCFTGAPGGDGLSSLSPPHPLRRKRVLASLKGPGEENDLLRRENAQEVLFAK